MSRMEDGIRKAARAIIQTMREEPPARELAQAVVDYDTMALEGYGAELEELRKKPDPVGFVEELLIIKPSGYIYGQKEWAEDCEADQLRQDDGGLPFEEY